MGDTVFSLTGPVMEPQTIRADSDVFYSLLSIQLNVFIMILLFYADCLEHDLEGNSRA